MQIFGNEVTENTKRIIRTDQSVVTCISATLTFMFASSRTHTSMRRSRLARYCQRKVFAEKQAQQRQRLNFVKWFEAIQLFIRMLELFQTGSKPPHDAV